MLPKLGLDYLLLLTFFALTSRCKSRVNNSPLGYVRQWIIENAQILAVVDMQRDLFQPQNDTQTSMVLLRRYSNDEKEVIRDYPIFFAVTDKIGHDKRGQPIYKRDADGRDILETRKVRVTMVKAGEVIEGDIEEVGPVIDDHLLLIPDLFKEWARKHAVM